MLKYTQITHTITSISDGMDWVGHIFHDTGGYVVAIGGLKSRSFQDIDSAIDYSERVYDTWTSDGVVDAR